MSKTLQTITILFLLFSTILSSAQRLTKPVRGTFLNFEHQNPRNKYMSPYGVDGTSSELWRLKIKEMSELGIKYIVLIFVANEGRAFYPSEFMPHAYPQGKESPVEAVMNAADEHDMKVFMSSGWAKNARDNSKNPETRAIQVKIMEETARLFSKHKSFYGWYLPCEDALNPYLKQEAVDAVNALAVEAKRVAPGSKVMISPYALFGVDFSKNDFAASIAKLKVDIIAYQDQIGVIANTLPMEQMKEIFSHLRPIHDKNGIELWANNESFTWEKEFRGVNSALIPAPMARFVSQMAGVSKAKVDEIISFTICNIFDKPGSAIPLGQPYYSAKAYTEYLEWKNGKGRWPLLDATFHGDLKHDAISKGVIFNLPPSSPFTKGILTDGKLGVEAFGNENWVGFEKQDVEATIDLGKIQPVEHLAARFLDYKPAGIFLPSLVEFAVSEDGKNYTILKSVPMDNAMTDRYDCWIDIASADNLNTKARYIRIYAINATGRWIFSDEIFVNPQF